MLKYIPNNLATIHILTYSGCIFFSIRRRNKFFPFFNPEKVLPVKGKQYLILFHPKNRSELCSFVQFIYSLVSFGDAQLFVDLSNLTPLHTLIMRQLHAIVWAWFGGILQKKYQPSFFWSLSWTSFRRDFLSDHLGNAFRGLFLPKHNSMVIKYSKRL